MARCLGEEKNVKVTWFNRLSVGSVTKIDSCWLHTALGLYFTNGEKKKTQNICLKMLMWKQHFVSQYTAENLKCVRLLQIIRCKSQPLICFAIPSMRQRNIFLLQLSAFDLNNSLWEVMKWDHSEACHDGPSSLSWHESSPCTLLRHRRMFHLHYRKKDGLENIN